ncbi:Uncharacterised protein [Mycobacteroides abscessus subsp. abscessus]|nr:Uncharacterised protein [Mycobacteroides abscessus subsp. abscessus]
MPMPSIALRTSAPMSGSRVDMGSALRLSTVTRKPRWISASAISTPM